MLHSTSGQTETDGLSAAILSDSKQSCQAQSDGSDSLAFSARADPKLRASAAARLSALAEFLPPTERALLRSVYQDGRSIPDLAELLHTPRSSLARRVRRLAARCRSPEFAFVVAHMRKWPAPMAYVGRACVLEGRSVRSAAASLGTTVHAARTLRTVILSMARGVQQTERAVIRQWRK